MPDQTAHQLLHLVIGGELTSVDAHDFRDLSKVEFVGAYPNYAEAAKAWRAKAQSTVDIRPDALLHPPRPPPLGPEPGWRLRDRPRPSRLAFGSHLRMRATLNAAIAEPQ